jgi:hypothetical protein
LTDADDHIPFFITTYIDLLIISSSHPHPIFLLLPRAVGLFLGEFNFGVVINKYGII